MAFQVNHNKDRRKVAAGTTLVLGLLKHFTECPSFVGGFPGAKRKSVAI
jgi:hypothetical protein